MNPGSPIGYFGNVFDQAWHNLLGFRVFQGKHHVHSIATLRTVGANSLLQIADGYAISAVGQKFPGTGIWGLGIGDPLPADGAPGVLAENIAGNWLRPEEGTVDKNG